MIKKFLYNLRKEDKHPSDKTLLEYVDGELKVRNANHTRQHIENCWNCRERLENIESVISQFVKFRKNIQNQFGEKPPNKWRGFKQKLREAAKEELEYTVKEKKPLRSFKKFFNFFDLSNLSPLQMQAWVASIAMVLIVAIIWNLVGIQTISASELLRKAKAAQTQKVKATKQAVVYQKLRIKRKDSKPIKWEVWQDKSLGGFRQNIGISEGKSIDTDGSESIPKTIANLSLILEKNQFDSRQPISSVGFSKWRTSLDKKIDSIGEIRLNNQEKHFVLTTENKSEVRSGEILKGVLQVRAADWHPVRQTLHVAADEGDVIYEMTELETRISSLDSYAKEFFIKDDKSIVVNNTSPVQDVTPEASPSVEENPEADESKKESKEVEKKQSVAPKAVASYELEVDVLTLLSKAKADLGEQITVKRKNGILRVQGIVETAERKKEVLEFLSPIRGNPAVELQIRTVAEAVATQKNKTDKPIKVEKLQTTDSGIAVENELIDFFGSQTKARSYARQIVSLSGRAKSRVYTLKRLAGQFTSSELEKLSPKAKAKWLALIRNHSSAVQKDTQMLRSELRKVFGAKSVPGGKTKPVNGIADVSVAVESLLSLVLTNDQIIRSAMTISIGNRRFSAIKTTQFWTSLKSAEILAAKLQRVR